MRLFCVDAPEFKYCHSWCVCIIILKESLCTQNPVDTDEWQKGNVGHFKKNVWEISHPSFSFCLSCVHVWASFLWVEWNWTFKNGLRCCSFYFWKVIHIRFLECVVAVLKYSGFLGWFLVFCLTTPSWVWRSSETMGLGVCLVDTASRCHWAWFTLLKVCINSRSGPM